MGGGGQTLGVDMRMKIRGMDSVPAPDIDSIFLDEIIRPGRSILEKCLDESELRIVWSFGQEYKPYSPKNLKNIFSKLLRYFEENRAQLPAMHWVRRKSKFKKGSSLCWDSESFDFVKKGKKYHCTVSGFHFDGEHRNELSVTFRPRLSGKSVVWVPAKPMINVEGVEIVVDTRDLYVGFGPLLREIIEYCDVAIKANKKILVNIG